MEFNPNNPMVKLCIQGMEYEELNKHQEANKLFLQAWNIATNDFEKYLAAYYLARQQKNIHDKLKWLEESLQLALKVNNESVQAAFPVLHLKIAKCYEKLDDSDNAGRYFELAHSIRETPLDQGPFYHGTKADLQIGDLLTAGNMSNYKSGLKMNHIYFTALINGAGLAASLAKGDGRERVYIVEPTGRFENDPNVTNKKFPGNPTRSYRTQAPLKIISEVKDWTKLTSEQLKKWKEKLANNKGNIIN